MKQDKAGTQKRHFLQGGFDKSHNGHRMTQVHQAAIQRRLMIGQEYILLFSLQRIVVVYVNPKYTRTEQTIVQSPNTVLIGLLQKK